MYNTAVLLLVGGMVTIPSSLFVVAEASRNPNKGVSFSGAQSCTTLQPHSDSSWWYTWSTQNGFESGNKFNLCDVAAYLTDTSNPHPVTEARSNGMEFVPNFWSFVPALNELDSKTIANLQAASYVMTFNEPERTDQANLTPAAAAAMWANLVAIANQYQLQIVAPCMTKDAFSWFDEFLVECDSLYPGEGCHFDATCIHIYQQPHPCDVTKNWECIGDETGYHARSYINRWYNDYGNKPVWITEYGCYPWTSTPGCTPQQHEDILEQLTGIFESPEMQGIVGRYAWFTTFAFGGELGFAPGALNIPNWDIVSSEICPNNEWLANAYPGFSWGIKTVLECLQLAEANAICADGGSIIMMDDDNCYCATDSCDVTNSAWPQMKIYREVPPLTRYEADLTAMGHMYNDFGATVTTPNPTPKPTLDPTLSSTCNLNGSCDAGESCITCLDDCPSGSFPGTATCGNNVCETADGENCVTCPGDCNGVQGGKPSDRYCCGDGGGANPIGCEDNRCGGSQCTATPVQDGTYCCGNAACENGETSLTCELDCPTPPPTTVTSSPSVAPVAGCLPLGVSCSIDGDCCGNKCRGSKCK